MKTFSRVFLLMIVAVQVLLAEPAAKALARPVSPAELTPKHYQQTMGSAGGPGAAAISMPSASTLSSELTVRPERIVLQGAFAEKGLDAGSLITPLEGKALTVSRMYRLAHDIEALYARAGFVLARVTIPPQALEDGGTLQLLVVDGTIDQIQADNLPLIIRDRVINQLSGLKGKRHLRLEEIERHLLLSGELPGLRLKSALSAGKAPGTTDIIADGTYERVSRIVTISNDLPASAGHVRRSGWVNFNGLFGQGEQIYGALSSSIADRFPFQSDSAFSALGIGAVIPVGSNGMTLAPEYSRTETLSHAKGQFPAERQTFERVALRGNFALVRNRKQALDLGLSLEHLDQKGELADFGLPLSHDSYFVARMSAREQFWLGGVMMNVSLTQSQGLGGRDEGEGQGSGTPLSRGGADPFFSKLEGDLHLSAPLSQDVRSDLYGSFQYSFGAPMMQSESFSLDGPHGLAGFEPGHYSVDTGAVVRLELSRPTDFPWSGKTVTLAPYVFAAAGWGMLEKPTALEQAESFVQSAGFGLRTDISQDQDRRGLSSNLEFGLGHDSGTGDVAWRVFTTLEARF